MGLWCISYSLAWKQNNFSWGGGILVHYMTYSPITYIITTFLKYFFRKAHFQEVVTNFNPCPEQRGSFNPCCKTRLFLQALLWNNTLCSAKLPIPCFKFAQLHIVKCSHPLHHFPEFHFANLPTQHCHIVNRLANFHVWIIPTSMTWTLMNCMHLGSPFLYSL